MIPEDLKIFSLIYEYSDFVILPLLAIYAAGGLYLLFRLKKNIFPLAADLSPCDLSAGDRFYILRLALPHGTAEPFCRDRQQRLYGSVYFPTCRYRFDAA